MKPNYNILNPNHKIHSNQLGKLRNTIGSNTRIFKYCNRAKCFFNINNNNENANNITDNYTNFQSYHILNSDELLFENIESTLENGPDKTKSLMFNNIPFTPLQIKKTYKINTISPFIGIRRPIVTIISAFNNPYLRNDVNKFGNVFKLPVCNFKIYNFSKVFNPNWAMETTLDVQWVYAINPYAILRVICAKSSSGPDMLNAILFANNKNNFNPPINSDIITMSFGTRDNGTYKSYNRTFNNSETIYITASGDSSMVSFPSCCTNVLAIGGTSLTINSDNNRNTEKVWSLSGCGISKSFLKPAYQPTNLTNRSTPDMCCIADSKPGCYVVLNLKLYSMGGTSLSAPIYAGIMSLITQDRLNNKKAPYTSVANKPNSIQPLLYNLLNKPDSYYDVTNGSSSNNNATIGFDIASGLGVINVENIIENLKSI